MNDRLEGTFVCQNCGKENSYPKISKDKESICPSYEDYQIEPFKREEDRFNYCDYKLKREIKYWECSLCGEKHKFDSELVGDE